MSCQNNMIFEVAGIQRCSVVDFPGKIADVVFTSGCNMNCFYCHNQHIVDSDMLVDEKEVYTILKRHVGFADGVVISGGEPTLQKGLKDFIKHICGMGFLVKLDTNGTNPKILSELIDEKLVDYIAMDIKAPMSRYNELCGTEIDLNVIDESISIIMSGKVDYEFRTTVPTSLSQDDIVEIAKWISGAKRYYLQQYRNIQSGVISFGKYRHSDLDLLTMAEKAGNFVEMCECRGILLERKMD